MKVCYVCTVKYFASCLYRLYGLLPRTFYQSLRAIGFGKGNSSTAALAEARVVLSQFDTLDELHAVTKPGDRLREAQDVLVTALTYWKDGSAQTRHNEIKVANPSVLGVAAFRKAGQLVNIDGVDDAVLGRLFGGQGRPDWVTTGKPLSDEELVIPPEVINILEKNKMPLVIVDWTRDDLNGPTYDDG